MDIECYDVLLLSSTLKLRGQGRDCMIPPDAFFRRQVSGTIAPSSATTLGAL